MRNGLQFCGLRVAATYSCTVLCRGFRHTVPKADQRIYSDAPHRESHWSFPWLNLVVRSEIFNLCNCVPTLFKGQQLSKLQSMPNKIHTHGRISNIPNKLLLAGLYFETTSFHSSADSFHSLFLPLECFCKSAYKLLALNKKMLGFFVVVWMGFF